MKGYNFWSYAPYKPLLRDVGDIYICRIAPSENSIHFEWLNIGEAEYSVFYRQRNTADFMLCGKTTGTEFDIDNLKTDTDFEFYVCSGEKKSLIRLARTGKTVGTVVNYLHPDDDAYSFSGRYLCSPSLVRHPDGFLLASMDLFGHSAPQNLTLIFRSDDDGETWYYVSELMPCFWGKLFIHKGELYMLGCSTEYGDVIIGKSSDGGKTFSAPVCLLRGANGKSGQPGFHKNPQNIFKYNGRIYETIEWGTWTGGCRSEGITHCCMVMSCDENDDLLVPENWSFTEPQKADTSEGDNIEGTIVLDKKGRLLNVMRICDTGGKAALYEIDKLNHEAALKKVGYIDFPCHNSKFMIKYDEISDKYYSVATRIYAGNGTNRNLLSLMVSDDLESWSIATDIYDYRGVDDEHIGFQYVDFEIEGEDIIFLSRTAMNKAHNFHDSNYSTFQRIQNFRKL